MIINQRRWMLNLKLNNWDYEKWKRPNRTPTIYGSTKQNLPLP